MPVNVASLQKDQSKHPFISMWYDIANDWQYIPTALSILYKFRSIHPLCVKPLLLFPLSLLWDKLSHNYHCYYYASKTFIQNLLQNSKKCLRILYIVFSIRPLKSDMLQTLFQMGSKSFDQSENPLPSHIFYASYYRFTQNF